MQGYAGNAAIAFLAAAVAGLPGIAVLPYLADDWANLAAAAKGLPGRTPFGDFQRLDLATFRAERLLRGLSPSLSHLVNLTVIATAAALVVVLARRLTGDGAAAGWTGLLFARHP